MFGGHIRTEIPIAWVDWWVDKEVAARSDTKLCGKLNTDFTEEKMVAGAGFEPTTFGL